MPATSNKSRAWLAPNVVANPLRAGLVNKIGDYPFWNAVWMQVMLSRKNVLNKSRAWSAPTGGM